jgi:cell division initiation protein
MKAEDIRKVSFEKVMRGYRMDEVDAYLAQVATEMERLQAEKEDNEKKLFILAEKVDQYRNDEETLKSALLNAQRMGESVIHEARQKAETILYDANTKASQLKEEASESVVGLENELARLKAEVAKFKCDVLELYRQHIESLSAVPGEDLRAARRASKRTAGAAAEEPAVEAEQEKEPEKPADEKEENAVPKLEKTPFDLTLPELEEEEDEESLGTYHNLSLDD